MTTTEKNSERNIKLKSTLGTIIFYGCLLVLFLFLGFRTPLPLPEEEGIDVILGEDNFGMESIVDEALANIEEPIVEQVPEEPVTEEPEPVESESEILTRDTEDAPVVEEKKEEVKPDIETKENIEQKEPVKPVRKPDQNFMFNKSDKPGKGNDNVPGNKGSEDGNPDSKNWGTGGGEGFSFKMSGRGLVKRPPKIQAAPGNPQRVVITITVNSEGKVIDAKVNPKGSTILTGPDVQKALAAARKTEFTAKAVEIQEGTLTFNFIN